MMKQLVIKEALAFLKRFKKKRITITYMLVILTQLALPMIPLDINSSLGVGTEAMAASILEPESDAGGKLDDFKEESIVDEIIPIISIILQYIVPHICALVILYKIGPGFVEERGIAWGTIIKLVLLGVVSGSIGYFIK